MLPTGRRRATIVFAMAALTLVAAAAVTATMWRYQPVGLVSEDPPVVAVWDRILHRTCLSSAQGLNCPGDN